MKIIAQSKSVKISPRKLRLITDVIRSYSLEKALITLETLQKRGALEVLKTLKSAIVNAEHNSKLSKDKLLVDSIEINEGPALKRFRPSTRGRVHPYKRKSSHIRIILKERSQNGTKN